MNRFLLILLPLIYVFELSAQTEPCGFDLMQKKYLEEHPEVEVSNEPFVKPMFRSAETSADDILYIPVVVHVIHASGEAIGIGSNISVSRINSQIDVLNEDYMRMNSDTGSTPSDFKSVAGSAGIRFCLASRDPSGNPTDGITRHIYTIPDADYVEDVIKPATNWNSNYYLNIWVLDHPISGLLGYSYLPYSSMIGTTDDGVVIDYRYFGNGFGATGQGRTATHEIGHYLGLTHTWANRSGAGGCGNDDGITDTPLQSAANYGCPSHPSTSCSTADMFMNFMDYSNDNCMNLFTIGQSDLMRSVLYGTSGISGYGSRKNLIDWSWANCSGVSSTEEHVIQELTIYPNSSEGTVYLSTSEQGVVSILAVDGRLVHHEEIEQTITLDLEHLPAGVYNLILQTDENVISRKLVIN